MKNRVDLSVVIPAYNEEGVIGRCVARTRAFFKSRHARFEMIVVDDGSKDGTAAAVRELAKRHPELSLLSCPGNMGKGYAVRKGVLAARGGEILFLDADLSTAPSQWPKLESRLRAGADVAIGSRKMAGARLLRRQPWWRERMGKVFTFLVRAMLVDVSDVTCGFKAMKREAARRVFSKALVNDWSFDAEFLFLASRMGMRIDEVPVAWRDDPSTKVRLLRDTFSSLKGLLFIRLGALLGRYGRLG